jgi:hypothetical protein
MILYETCDGDHRTYFHKREDAENSADLQAKVTDYGMNGFIFVDKVSTSLAGKPLVLAILNDTDGNGRNWIEERERVYERIKP